MTEKTEGLVLRTLRYDDTRVIVDIFTQSRGVVPFVVKASRSRRSSVRTALFVPLAWLEVDFDYRERQRLQHIADVRVCQPWQSLPYQPMKATIALFLSESLYYALRDEHANPDLYAYLTRSLQWLDLCPQGFANFPIAFLIRLSRFLGFWPSEEEAAQLVSPEERHLIPLLLRIDFSTMHLFQFTTPQRQRLLSVLNNYYRHHLPGFPELQSMAILREVLG